MTEQQQAADAQAEQPKLEITTSRNFIRWLAGERMSLAFSTYQAAKLFLIGLSPQGGLSVFERTLERIMGLTAHRDELWLSTIYQLWRFRNVLPAGGVYEGYDRLYIPRESRITGDIDVHDMAVESSGRLVFINTLFNCLATIDDDYSFRPLWQPEWIDRLAAEDRCHLNGLALRDGKARYATAVSRSNVSDGWRDKRVGGGVVVDIESGEILCEDLTMPHSPRWYAGKLWLVDSGTGYFGHVDLDRRQFVPMTFLPGYARGMAFQGNWAVIGLSDRRRDKAFEGLPLGDELEKHGAESRCGLQIVDINTGEAPHWMRIEGVVKELYDVVVLPGAIRPMAIGFKTDEIRRMISHPGL